MPIKILSALIAVVLVVGFLSPMVFKLKDAALGAVIAIGITMMLIDLWQSLQAKDQ
jgi:predicted ABC-type exoprotein transport system permease subunit